MYWGLRACPQENWILRPLRLILGVYRWARRNGHLVECITQCSDTRDNYTFWLSAISGQLSSYYAGIMLGASCIYADLSGDCLDKEIKKLFQCCAVVSPACYFCRSDDKKPICTHSTNIVKRQKA